LSIIKLTTEINNANIEIVFDLIRSIDLQKISTHKSKEEAIARKTSGLISLNKSDIWRAKHLGFGFTQELTSKRTDYNYQFFFTDGMVKGVFNSFDTNIILSKKRTA
jgi:hypothetical protein